VGGAARHLGHAHRPGPRPRRPSAANLTHAPRRTRGPEESVLGAPRSGREAPRPRGPAPPAAARPSQELRPSGRSPLVAAASRWARQPVGHRPRGGAGRDVDALPVLGRAAVSPGWAEAVAGEEVGRNAAVCGGFSFPRRRPAPAPAPAPDGRPPGAGGLGKLVVRPQPWPRGPGLGWSVPWQSPPLQVRGVQREGFLAVLAALEPASAWRGRCGRNPHLIKRAAEMCSGGWARGSYGGFNSPLPPVFHPEQGASAVHLSNAKGEGVLFL
jgi:hypothetical protein